ncbi:nuclear transport factor 2 family protein [Streptomyces sp. NPDC057428]|uniref:nuclear transport factor 2 family protein n=1 Tax=Streptomyces sp. NPDC057428 TaxID=3346129 RepID=UPI00367ABB4A
MSDRLEIIEVLARYVRALEERDAKAVAALFAPEGAFEIQSRSGREAYATRVTVTGPDKIQALMESGTLPATRGNQYFTTDHIVDIDGDEARMDAQFLTVESNVEGTAGQNWPVGSVMLQGALALSMAGHYASVLRKIDGRWALTSHRVRHNLPMAVPPAK